MLSGIVSYRDTITANSPFGSVFRKVFLRPGEDPAVLDDPKWVTFGCDPTREAVMLKLPADHPAVGAPFTGTP